MKKTVLLRAPLLTQSGYGVHSRQVVRWLLSHQDKIELKVQLLPWGDTPWILKGNQEDNLISEIMERSVPFDKQFDVTFQLQLPNEWDASLGKFNVGLTAAVETDRCNPNWKLACNKMNEIVVPSNHTKNNLLSHGDLSTNITVIPEAFPDACLTKNLQQPDVDLLPNVKTKFNFLIFGQLTGNNIYTDRKNTFSMLRWLFEEFKDDPDVGIILKTNAGRNTLIDKNKVIGIVSSIIKNYRQGNFPRVHIVHGSMNENEVASLYTNKKIKALVAATRGEGFGLPLLEAAAAGLPIIATDWSGHLDFLNRGKFIKLFYDLTEIPAERIDNNIFMKGSRWADVSEVDFKSKVSKFKNKPNIPQQWAKELQTKIQDNYNMSNISKLYNQQFEKILCTQ